ncbi:MAG: magnesium transporter [Gemmatimonadota bacterium]|nr:magnesium transporter [Gemmatimonadota bacterium]MDH3421446.1 magnesium transporter [Gemmatimonadota bacterium]
MTSTSTPQEELEGVGTRIRELLLRGDATGAGEAAGAMHASDLADLLEELDEELRIPLLSAVPVELASGALAEMEEGEDRGDLLSALTPAMRAEFLHELADDDAADLIGDLEPPEQQRILDALPAEEADDLIDLLKYDEDSAGGLMTTELVALNATLTAGEAIEEVRIQGREIEDFYTVFVVDSEKRLLGTLRLDDLVIADPGSLVGELVEAPIATVLPDVDQEEVGRLISRYNLVAIPVVTEDDVLLGRITFDDVIDVIEAEQTEDILRLAGLNDEDDLRHSWQQAVRARLPWLSLNLMTAALAASVILVYEDVIDQVITLAFLAPIIAAMGGSSGTQSLAITIRRITVEGSGRTRGHVMREILIGLVNGAVLGIGIAVLALLVDGDPRLGLVVLLAMWGNQIVAGFAGAFVPATLDRMGIDPSIASSVFVHTLTDLCGFFLLLGLASRLLL